jgi:hypothetical protein
MDLKDLPDSELPIMENIFRQLVLHKKLMTKYVWEQYRDDLGIPQIPNDEDIAYLNSRLMWLVDWRFALAHLNSDEDEARYTLIEFDDQHRSLKWHRDQAILKYQQDLEAIQSQKRKETSEIWQRRFNYVVALVGIGLVVAQIILTTIDNKDDKGTQREIDQLRYEVDSLRSSLPYSKDTITK